LTFAIFAINQIFQLTFAQCLHLSKHILFAHKTIHAVKQLGHSWHLFSNSFVRLLNQLLKN